MEKEVEKTTAEQQQRVENYSRNGSLLGCTLGFVGGVRALQPRPSMVPFFGCVAGGFTGGLFFRYLANKINENYYHSLTDPKDDCKDNKLFIKLRSS